MVVALLVLTPTFSTTAAVSSGSTPTFDPEQPFPGGGAYWEPAIAADPGSSYVYQAVTYINASKTCSGCPGTAIFLRSSSDGGATWGAAHPVSLAHGQGWQFDPQIQVAADGIDRLQQLAPVLQPGHADAVGQPQVADREVLVVGIGAPLRKNPLSTSFSVPSPPTATSTGRDSRTARSAISVASSGRVVKAVS